MISGPSGFHARLQWINSFEAALLQRVQKGVENIESKFTPRHLRIISFKQHLCFTSNYGTINQLCLQNLTFLVTFHFMLMIVDLMMILSKGVNFGATFQVEEDLCMLILDPFVMTIQPLGMPNVVEARNCYLYVLLFAWPLLHGNWPSFYSSG